MNILDIIKAFIGAIVGLFLFFGLSIVLLQLDILLNL
jgi:ABC-type antimicrobial peptide transport system permease subunit